MAKRRKYKDKRKGEMNLRKYFRKQKIEGHQKQVKEFQRGQQSAKTTVSGFWFCECKEVDEKGETVYRRNSNLVERCNICGAKRPDLEE